MPRVPKYRRHTLRDFAFVERQGKRIRLPGRHNSPESLRAYAAFIKEIGADRPAPTPAPVPGQPITVAHLVLLYLQWAATYYVNTDGSPNKEYGQLKYAAGPLCVVAGDVLVSDFGPLKLEEVRNAMVSGSWDIRTHPDTGEEAPRPWTRPHINRQINRIRRIFRWGVQRELVPGPVMIALETLAPLRKGRTKAAEPPPIAPVPPGAVFAVLPFLTPVTSAMVRLQHLTGLRSQSLVAMRPMDIDTSRDVWLYVPAKHKGTWRKRDYDHQGDDDLVVPLGPRCQEILRPFLEGRPEGACLFSPKESEAWRNGRRRKRRKSPMTPSQTKRNAKGPRADRNRPRGDSYPVTSYWRAIQYAIKKAAKRGIIIPQWFPHQLRHTRGTLIREAYGVEASRVYLGHSHVDVTQIYAERDLSEALRIARELG